MITGVTFIAFIAFVSGWSLEPTGLQHCNQISFIDIVLRRNVCDVYVSYPILQDLSCRIVIDYLILKPLIEHRRHGTNSGVANTWSNDWSPFYFTRYLVA